MDDLVTFSPRADEPDTPAHRAHLIEETAGAGHRLAETVAGFEHVVGLQDPVAVHELGKDVLDLIDGQGYARPKPFWASGHPTPPPVDKGRHSIDDLNRVIRPKLQEVIDKALGGERPARDETELLFTARGVEVDAVCDVADAVRRRRVGDGVSFVVTRNIQYTNMCTYRCRFCAFSKGPRSLNLRGDPYLMDIEEVVDRSREAWDRGATEVCMQGGIHPDFTGRYYLDVCRAVKETLPDLHVHAFSALEVWQGAHTLGVSLDDYLPMLRDAGLSSLPGTAAEVLDDDVRAIICPDKVTTEEWVAVQRAAAKAGLRSNVTIMFGHVDGPRHWANHLEVTARLQEETGHLTEFVPLPFVHMAAPLYLQGKARPGPTWDEAVLMHAVPRLRLQGLIDNIQVSWVKMGVEGSRRCLEAGCNDLGGTLMNESISRSAGAEHGQEMDPFRMEALIRASGRVPRQRTTLYEDVTEERVAAARRAAPLQERVLTPIRLTRKAVAAG